MAIVFGILAGAGSSFWNAVLSYILQVKNLNKALSEKDNPGAAVKAVGA